MTHKRGLSLFLQLIPMMLLLWGFLALRLYKIDESLPFFVDETRHLERAQIIWSFSDMHISTTPGKFLLYYWLGIFGVPDHQAHWMSRTPVALFGLLGAAGTFALGLTLFSRAVGWIAVIILSLLPFMMFYERLALTDPFTASLVVLATWWSVVTIRRPTRRRALILGVLISLMLMAKILAVPLIVLPGLAILFLSPIRFTPTWEFVRTQLVTYRPVLVRIELVVLLIWGILMGIYIIRKIVDPNVDAIVDTYLYRGVEYNLGTRDEYIRADLENLGNEPNVFAVNLERLVQGLLLMWGPLLLILIIFGMPFVIRRYRSETIYLSAAILLVWFLLIFVAGRLSTRYLTIVGHLAIVLTAAGIWTLRSELKRLEKVPLLSALPLAILIVWIVGFSLPFWSTLTTDATALNVPTRDQWEYFRNQSAYGIQEALDTLETMPSISIGSEQPMVMGVVRNCPMLHYSLSGEEPYTLICPRIGHDVPAQPAADLTDLLDTYHAVYVVIEEFDQPDLPSVSLIKRHLLQANWQEIQAFPRPFDGVIVKLYVVSKDETVKWFPLLGG